MDNFSQRWRLRKLRTIKWAWFGSRNSVDGWVCPSSSSALEQNRTIEVCAVLCITCIGGDCYESPYFHIFTSYHILSGALSYQPTDCFIICFTTDHTPFHYRSRTHVGHMPNTWMTSYMPTPHGLPIVYTPPTLVAHMVVSVLLLTCSYHSYLMVSRTSSIQHWVKGVEHL